MSLLEVLELIRLGEGDTVEFKRKITSDIGRDIVAFANTEGGVILIGVDDDGNVVGVEEDVMQKLSDILLNIVPHISVKVDKVTIEGRKVYLIRVPKSDKIHTFRYIAYVRVGRNVRPLDLNELLERAAEAVLYFFDRAPSAAPASELDLNILKWFLETRENVRNVKSYGDLLDIARKLNIIVSKNNEEFLSGAGLLFFTENPSKYVPWARIHLVKFLDRDMSRVAYHRFVEGPVWRIIDELEEYFRTNLARIPLRGVRWRRIELYEYPVDALREAITNALAHRNYLIPAEVQVFILPDKIIVKNPGSFPPGVTPDNPRHIPRNPLLCQYLYDIGYIEKWGTGIYRMKQACREHPLVDLKFNIQPYYTEVIFEKRGDVGDLLDEKDREILDVISTLGRARSSEIAKRVGLSKTSVVARLKKLEKLGLVSRRSRGAKTYYVVR